MSRKIETVNIGNKTIGKGNHCYVVSEIGNNHDGNIETAKALIKASYETGADAVKFQTVKSFDLVNPNVPANAYPGWNVSDKFEYWYQFIDTIATPYQWYDELIPCAKKLGLAFISTPASIEAAHFLAEKKADAIKIASMDLNNIPFLKEVDKLGLPVILATGMSTLEEITESVSVFKKSPLIILHCVSNYPLNPEDANLLNIKMLKDKFNRPVGFSNHALGYDLDIAAVSLGACIIEKHFTFNRSNPNMAEHHFSMEPGEMKEMIKKIRLIEKALGVYNRTMTDAELQTRDLSRRSITIKRDLQAGEKIFEQDLMVVRPGSGIAPKHLNEVIGKKVKVALKAFEILQWQDLQ